MKKVFPFLVTGILSTFLALGIFTYLDNDDVQKEVVIQQPILTNYSPKQPVTSLTKQITSPDLVMAANTSKIAVVFIESRTIVPAGYFSRRHAEASTGSGVIISEDGYIATNHHVIDGGDEITVLLDDGREYEAKLIGSDPSTDLALLKVDAETLPHLTFGNSDSLMVGEWVMAIGNPFRLYSTVTAGIVSAKSRNINILDETGIESFIQTDAAVNPGNSGGALVDARGQLMGINTAILTFSGQYEGFSFAVPANIAKKVLEDIRDFGSTQRGWLGVVIRPVDASLAKAADLQEVSGVIIEQVNASSAADQAGLQPGDVVIAIDGQKINTTPDFMGKVGQHRPGDALRFEFIRKQKKKETTVVLSDSRTSVTPRVASSKSPKEMLTELGMLVREMNTTEVERLPKKGIVVKSIVSGGPVDHVNMEEDFIITKINGVTVASVDDFHKELKMAVSGLYLEGYYEGYAGNFAYSLDLD